MFDGDSGAAVGAVRRVERYANGVKWTKKDSDGDVRYGRGKLCDRLR